MNFFKKTIGEIVEVLFLLSAFFIARTVGYIDALYVVPFYVDGFLAIGFCIIIMVYSFIFWRLPLLIKKNDKEDKSE